MLRVIVTIFALVIVETTYAQYVVNIKIKSAPGNHISNNGLYLAGSFNNWNPQSDQFKFRQDEKGNYFIQLTLSPGTYEYKMTRGGWDKVECSKNGTGIGNRVLKVDADTTIEISIEGWQDQFKTTPRRSTASKNVRIMDTAFYIPQLNRARRVWVYLPEGYTSSKQRYPVLYMHDGQNVFEDTSSFSGEWGVDEFLDSTSTRQCIVVAIDNGGNKRLNEYNPYNNERFGKGEGSEYVDFIVKTLKPFIDKEYRTLKGKRKDCIAGSSMGGLISLYAVMKYPKVFGAAGIYSPAFWTAPKIYDEIKKKAKKIRSNIYFYAGKQEGERMVPDMLKVFGNLARRSKSKIELVIRDEGKHHEATWRKEFAAGYFWMLYGKKTTPLSSRR